MDNLALYIESLIFATDQPIDRNELRVALENCFDTQIPVEEVDAAVEQVIEKFSDDNFAIEVVEIAGGLQFLSKPAFHHAIGSHLRQLSNKRLSRVALETLAIIAYKQPVPKSEIEKIRGVNCDYAIQKLLEKELITIEGRDEGPGRPLLYATSPKFMDYLGLRDMKDLPKLKELETADNSIGDGDTDEDLASYLHEESTPLEETDTPEYTDEPEVGEEEIDEPQHSEDVVSETVEEAAESDVHNGTTS